MKSPALLAGGVGVGGILAALLLQPANHPADSTSATAAPPARVPAVAQAFPAPLARDLQAPREAPPPVVLHGVIYRGREGARSQVLLSVEGQPGQAYGIGDAVTRGWSVHAIHMQRVVLAKGAERAAIDVAAPASSAAALAAPAPKSSAPTEARALPGFVAGPRPAVTDTPAKERNRRFLNAVQGGGAAQ